MSAPPLALSREGSSWPVRLIIDVASRKPSSIEPESPMNMRARWMLWGRKPRHTPTSATVSSEAVVARTSSCS